MMNSSTSEYPIDNKEEGIQFSTDQLVLNATGTIAHDTHKFVSDTAIFYVKAIVFVLGAGCFSIIGIAANIINMIVFIRQGIFTDSGTASLFGLAVADMCCVVTMLWKCFTFSFVLADPPNHIWDPWGFWYLSAGWPQHMFAQITRMVTAYVAFERCICVVFPFKVKSLFTPWRSIIIVASIFVSFGISHTPIFVVQKLMFTFDHQTNTTRLMLVSSQGWQRTVDIMWYINSLTFNLGAVAIVLICTVITVARVKLSKVWRESLATGGSSKPEESRVKSQPSGMSKSRIQKENKLVRMITSISIVFLICFTPDLTFLLMFSINPEIRIGRQYDNLAMVMYSFTFLMEAINSSMNIIVYYNMSSRYKQELKALFGSSKAA